MNQAEDYSQYFGLHELSNYVFAKKYRRVIEEEFRELEEELYQDAPIVQTCVDYNLGRIYFGSGGGLEDFVLNMIEQKEAYVRLLEQLRKQEELFDMAMDSLTPREKDVIQVHYFNQENQLGLSLEFFNEVLTEAQEKLCSFIQKEIVKQREEMEEERKERLKNEIKSS